MSLDIINFLKISLLGDDSLNESVDWCEINGNLKTHELCSNAFIDELVGFIRSLLMTYCPIALPIVDYYPVSKTAPVIITGDSDDATIDEINNYFGLLDTHGCKSNLLIKNPILFKEMNLFDNNFETHCLGIHPFSVNNNFQEYTQELQKLHELFISKTAVNSTSLLRNHFFQNINARKQIEFEREKNIHFDLNSVLVNGCAWIGTGNGTGFPIPFPPINGNYNIYPLTLTTVIEDDVFLFDYEYCYKPYMNDEYSDDMLIISFLQKWVLEMNKTAQINFHPENPTYLLNLIINWIVQNDIWNPNIHEFHMWLLERDSTNVIIIRDKYEIISNSKRLKIRKNENLCERV